MKSRKYEERCRRIKFGPREAKGRKEGRKGRNATPFRGLSRAQTDRDVIPVIGTRSVVGNVGEGDISLTFTSRKSSHPVRQTPFYSLVSLRLDFSQYRVYPFLKQTLPFFLNQEFYP